MSSFQVPPPESSAHFTNAAVWTSLSDLFWVNIYKAQMGHKPKRRKRQCRGILNSQRKFREGFTSPTLNL